MRLALTAFALFCCAGLAKAEGADRQAYRPSANTGASANAALCKGMAPFLAGQREGGTLDNPARAPDAAETIVIDNAKIEILVERAHAKGAFIVDADNDGKQDLVAWSIDGSGRFSYAEIYGFEQTQPGPYTALRPKLSLDLGVIEEPRFVRFKGVNYVISLDDGGDESMRVSRVVKQFDDKYEQQTVCSMQLVLEPDEACRHPACKALQAKIKDPARNAEFVNVEWPHKYFSPAGMSVYSPEKGSKGDFDNSGKPTTLWRFGRDGYLYQHVYWGLLGQGDVPPPVDPKLRPVSEDEAPRKILPGPQHERLRRTLAEQSEALGKQLQKPVSLPGLGHFFLFQANGNRTYWAWDFGGFGEEIHILYTNASKSDYVGTVRVKRLQVLAPCLQACTYINTR